MSARKQQILAEILAEREAQDAQWGGPEHDDEHDPTDFMSFINDQMMKCDYGRGPDIRDRFVKIAALAVAAIEMIDRTTADYGSNDDE